MTASRFDILIIIILIFSNINIQAQESDSIDYQEVLIDALQGKIIDPVICNEIGLEMIGSVQNPNFGLNVDYKPIFLNRYIFKIGYRTGFNENYMFNSSIETKYLIRQKQKSIDFQINYELYNLMDTKLEDYINYSFGSIYRFRWTSIGFNIGQDNYADKIGIDLIGNYKIHKLLYGSTDAYKGIADIKWSIGYWDNDFNYNLKIDYLINFSMSCGIGYKRLYDFDELYFTFRYLICR